LAKQVLKRFKRGLLGVMFSFFSLLLRLMLTVATLAPDFRPEAAEILVIDPFSVAIVEAVLWWCLDPEAPEVVVGGF
jgi:hypothetical protein